MLPKKKNRRKKSLPFWISHECNLRTHTIVLNFISSVKLNGAIVTEYKRDECMWTQKSGALVGHRTIERTEFSFRINLNIPHAVFGQYKFNKLRSITWTIYIRIRYGSWTKVLLCLLKIPRKKIHTYISTTFPRIFFSFRFVSFSLSFCCCLFYWYRTKSIHPPGSIYYCIKILCCTRTKAFNNDLKNITWCW